MRYYGEEALGMVETIGMVPALEACDKMLKAADVELISYENVGSTLVTILVKGDVAACRASVDAGKRAAEQIGKVTAANVIPRPIRIIGEFPPYLKLPRHNTSSPSPFPLCNCSTVTYIFLISLNYHFPIGQSQYLYHCCFSKSEAPCLHSGHT